MHKHTRGMMNPPCSLGPAQFDGKRTDITVARSSNCGRPTLILIYLTIKHVLFYFIFNIKS